MWVRKVQLSQQNKTHSINISNNSWTTDTVEYNTAHVILFWRPLHFEDESFSRSSYTHMMRDQIESHERMRESVCDTYRTNSTPPTSCSSSKPLQSPLHRRLRSRFLFHTRRKKNECEYEKSKHHVKINTQHQYLKHFPNPGHSRIQYSSSHLVEDHRILKKKASPDRRTHT